MSPPAAMCHEPPVPVPEAISVPFGLSFAALRKSARVLYGASALTVTPAGMRAMRENRSKLAGVRSPVPSAL